MDNMKKFILPIILLACTLSVHAQVSALYGNGGNGSSSSDSKADTVNTEFFQPYGSAFDTKGNLWITDQFNNYIVMINAGKYLIREGYLGGGFNDGASASQNGGLVDAPSGIIVVPGKTSASDQIYLCDANNNAIRKIDSFVSLGYGQKMSTVAGGGAKVSGTLGKSGYANGSGATALFKNPLGIGWISDPKGGYLIVADQGNNAIRKVSLHKDSLGYTSTITSGLANPQGIFVDASNNIYVASVVGGILKVSGSGNMTTVVPSSYLDAPTSLVIKGTDMYIADVCHIAYFDMTKPASGSNPTVIAGDPADATCAFKDGTYAQSLFSGIQSMVLSPDGTYLIVADAGNNRFRKVILPATHGAIAEYSNSISDKFKVYPNPAEDHVSISSEISGNADVNLVTMTGKQVCHNSLMLNKGQSIEMSLENQPAGVYILQINTASGIYNSKIIIR